MAAQPPTPTISPSTASLRRLAAEPIPAISLSLEPANITAIANDVGTEVIFLRSLSRSAARTTSPSQFPPAAARGTSSCRSKKPASASMLTVALLGYDGGEIQRRACGFSADRPLRLHSADSGNPGVDLSRDSRDAGGARPWRMLELFGTQELPLHAGNARMARMEGN